MNGKQVLLKNEAVFGISRWQMYLSRLCTAVLLGIALVLAMTEPDGDRALEWLRKASELGSLTYRDYPTMAIAYFKKGDYTSARRYIDDILYTTKDSSAAMLELAGDIYMKVELEYKGKRASDYTIRMWREKGREFYRKALERAPGNKALADKLMRAQAATE